MNRLSGSTRKISTHCRTVSAKFRCKSLTAPIPTAISKTALISLNNAIAKRVFELLRSRDGRRDDRADGIALDYRLPSQRIDETSKSDYSHSRHNGLQRS